MATQPCPGIAQVIISLQYDAQNIQNTLYFENTGGWIPGDMENLATAIDTAVAGSLMADYGQDVSYNGVTATDLTDLSSERHRIERVPAVVGGTVEDSAAANVAFCITFLTGSRGKGQQGRIFVGPIPDSQVLENKVTSIWANAYLVDLETVIAAGEASKPGTQHVVLSRWENKVKRPFGIGKLVTGVGPQNFYVDSQRDRLPFHKKHKKLTPAP